MNNISSVAKQFIDAGISVIPCTINKRPTIAWKIYQQTKLTHDECDSVFANAEAIAIVGGAVSGGLEIIDVDEKYAIDSSIFDEYCAIINEENPDLLAKLLIQKTPSGGYHIIYRTTQITGNRKLARRAATAAEQELDKHDRVKVLIETRGEGGYALVRPSPGYSVTQGAWSALHAVSNEEHALLFKAAVALNTFEDDVTVFGETITGTLSAMGIKPGEDFNLHGDHSIVLSDLGWRLSKNNTDREFWTRPGKERGISASWNKHTRRLAVFSSSTEFDTVLDTRTTYSLFGIVTKTQYHNNFHEAARALYKQGYGRKVDVIGATSVNADGEIIHTSYPKFWTEYVNPKTSEVEFKVDRFLLMQFIELNGFGKLWAGKSYQLIRVSANIVSEISAVNIKEFCQEYITLLPDELLNGHSKQTIINKLYAGASQFFGEPFLDFISAPKLEFLKDTPDSAYFFYENCFVKIIASESKSYAYSTMQGCIWAKQKIQRSYFEPDNEQAEIEVLARRICSTRSTTSPNDKPIVNEHKLSSLCSAIGYLLHRYKDKTLAKAIVLCDEKISEMSSGRTGKGLICTVLSYFRNTLRLDGRNFSFDKNFMFQSVSFDTDVLDFNDCVKDFPFDRLFSIITDDMMIERKNRDEFVLKFEDSPKIILSTNYSIIGDGASFNARIFEIELSDFYSDTFTPFMDFGHRLFDSWDKEEWSRFDRWAMRCLQVFLKHKLIEYAPVNIQKRRLIQKTSSDFLNFAEENWTVGTEYDKKQEFEKYCEMFNEHQIRQRTFTVWIRGYVLYKNHDLFERRTNGKSLFQINDKGTVPTVENRTPEIF